MISRTLSYDAPAGTRTPDTRLKRAVLYLLSYWGISKKSWDGGTRTHNDGVKVRCVTSYTTSHYKPAQPVGENQRVGYGARTHDTRNHNPVLYQLS